MRNLARWPKTPEMRSGMLIATLDSGNPQVPELKEVNTTVIDPLAIGVTLGGLLRDVVVPGPTRAGLASSPLSSDLVLRPGRAARGGSGVRSSADRERSSRSSCWSAPRYHLTALAAGSPSGA